MLIASISKLKVVLSLHMESFNKHYLTDWLTVSCFCDADRGVILFCQTTTWIKHQCHSYKLLQPCCTKYVLPVWMLPFHRHSFYRSSALVSVDTQLDIAVIFKAWYVIIGSIPCVISMAACECHCMPAGNLQNSCNTSHKVRVHLQTHGALLKQVENGQNSLTCQQAWQVKALNKQRQQSSVPHDLPQGCGARVSWCKFRNQSRPSTAADWSSYCLCSLFLSQPEILALSAGGHSNSGGTLLNAHAFSLLRRRLLNFLSAVLISSWVASGFAFRALRAFLASFSSWSNHGLTGKVFWHFAVVLPALRDCWLPCASLVIILLCTYGDYQMFYSLSTIKVKYEFEKVAADHIIYSTAY